MLGHKPSSINIKKIISIQSMFSDHNGIKVKINNIRKFEKVTNMWKLNNTLK